MLTCQQVVELITDYLEGALDEQRHAEVARHLSECDDCLIYASQLQLTGRLLASVPAATLTADDRAALIATYREWAMRQV